MVNWIPLFRFSFLLACHFTDHNLTHQRLGHIRKKASAHLLDDANSPPKRAKQMFDEENDDDEEDEEPVKKRPRRSGVQGESRKSVRKSAAPQQDEPSELRKPKRDAKKVQLSNNFTKQQISRATSINSATLAPEVHSNDTRTMNDEEAKTAKKLRCDKSTEVVQAMEEDAEGDVEKENQEPEDEDGDSEDEKPETAAKAREKVQTTLKSNSKDPYPDWKPGEPVPYAALCTTFSLIELTTKRLVISAHCSLFLRQVLRLTPQDLLPTIQLMINKLAADYAGIELGIGESLIMKAIGESTGRSLSVIKADQNEIGDLGLVAAKSRSNQPTMFRPKPLTVKGVLDGLMSIATIQGDGSQGRKIAGIKKLLSAADAALAGKGSKGIDVTKDKGGASEAKFIIRFLEGKLRLGLAEKTVLVGLAHALVIHETEKNGEKLPSSEQLAKGEAILKTVYRYIVLAIEFSICRMLTVL